MNGTCTQTEQHGLAEVIYSPEATLTMEGHSSCAHSNMGKQLEAVICKGWCPMNQLENPSFELYSAMQINLRLYIKLANEGNEYIAGNMVEEIGSTFKKVRLKMGDTYKDSLFAGLEEVYKELIEAHLEKRLKPIEKQDIRNASEGNYEKLVKILEYTFKLYKQVVEQVGLGYSYVLDKAEGWFSVAYFSIIVGMSDDKLHKSPIGEVFRKYGNFFESKNKPCPGIGTIVITLP